jgi:phosphoglycolate phosphatase
MKEYQRYQAMCANPAWIDSDAYLFDIDGTLLNTRDGVHYHAFQHALKAVFGITPRIEGIPVHGNTDMGILRALLRREGLPDADVEAGLPRVIQQMCDEVCANASGIRVDICPSIPDLLGSLHAAGKLLGIVSGNLEPIGWAKIQAAGLRHFFSFGCFSDPAESRQEIFRHGIAEARRRLGTAASVCVVGDTPSDIRAAQAVGIPIIAVATGIFPHSDLLCLSPDTCVRCCTELLETAALRCGTAETRDSA